MQDRGSGGGGTYRHVVSWNFTDNNNMNHDVDAHGENYNNENK